MAAGVAEVEVEVEAAGVEGMKVAGVAEMMVAGVAEMMVAGVAGMKEEEEVEDMAEVVAEEAMEVKEEVHQGKMIFGNHQLVRRITFAVITL